MRDAPLLELIAKLPPLNYHGITYESQFDHSRLNAQQQRVHEVMRRGEWRTLRQISDETGDPEASVSARLRSYRSDEYLKQFFIMQSERIPTLERRGFWRYRLLVKSGETQ
jgi:hypothetical protein